MASLEKDHGSRLETTGLNNGISILRYILDPLMTSTHCWAIHYLWVASHFESLQILTRVKSSHESGVTEIFKMSQVKSSHLKFTCVESTESHRIVIVCVAMYHACRNVNRRVATSGLWWRWWSTVSSKSVKHYCCRRFSWYTRTLCKSRISILSRDPFFVRLTVPNVF